MGLPGQTNITHRGDATSTNQHYFALHYDELLFYIVYVFTLFMFCSCFDGHNVDQWKAGEVLEVGA